MSNPPAEPLGTQSVFLRVLRDEDKASALLRATADANTGGVNARVFWTNPQTFSHIPGSPFAYWASSRALKAFALHEPVESNGRIVRLADHPDEQFRYMRLGWEVDRTNESRSWRDYQKGGTYSRFYCDLHLVVDWDHERRTYRGYTGRPGRQNERPSNVQHFFRAGLTWPRRTGGLSVRVHPAGCAFADKGPVVFVLEDDHNELMKLLAIMNSTPFRRLVELQLARVELAQSFDVGIIQSTPIPSMAGANAALSQLALQSYQIKRDLDRSVEYSHVFHLPPVLQVMGDALDLRTLEWAEKVRVSKATIDANERMIDRIALVSYGLSEGDIHLPEDVIASATQHQTNQTEVLTDLGPEAQFANGISDPDEGDEDTGNETSLTHVASSPADALISYSIGCAFGRWDIRFATGERPTPDLPDPFAPLPVCSPGMLVGEDGLPLNAAPHGYPLRVDDDGILVDDPGHPDDIARRSREALEVIVGDRAGAWETDICSALNVADLREYFRKGGFWQAHLKRYSKSRRKAPIYWLLQSPRRNYAIWLYLHRLTADTLFKALTRYAEPKLRREQDALARLKSGRAGAESQRDGRAIERELDKQQAVITDVQDFCERLARAANLGLSPDLNDGVVLTIAPLHELVPWKEPRRYWDELRAGKYPWSSIGSQLRDKGLVR